MLRSVKDTHSFCHITSIYNEFFDIALILQYLLKEQNDSVFDHNEVIYIPVFNEEMSSNKKKDVKIEVVLKMS